MKRCPQCSTVFDDSLDFCTNDGTPLVKEAFVMPSENPPANDADEEITVIHHEPITIDIHHKNEPHEPADYPFPPTANDAPIIVEKRRNGVKYLLFLVIGLILGGGLVLSVIAVWMIVFQKKPIEVTNTDNRSAAANAPPNTKLSPSPTPVTASAKHEKKTDAPDADFNGRVISQNAYVRSSPNKNSRQIDVLPTGDRLDIEERENENSPWYHVTCEHGTSGWMHGNTIKFTE